MYSYADRRYRIEDQLLLLVNQACLTINNSSYSHIHSYREDISICNQDKLYEMKLYLQQINSYHTDADADIQQSKPRHNNKSSDMNKNNYIQKKYFKCNDNNH